MNVAQMPDWMKQRSIQQQEDAILRVMGTEGAQFWGAFFREMEKSVGFLPQIGAYGSVAHLSTIADDEQRYRLNVGRRGRLASISYTDIFYLPKVGTITCRTLEGDLSVFRLCLLPEGGIGVIPEDEFVRLDVHSFAERLIADAVDRQS
jgi:hypothetical protein